MDYLLWDSVNQTGTGVISESSERVAHLLAEEQNRFHRIVNAFLAEQ